MKMLTRDELVCIVHGSCVRGEWERLEPVIAQAAQAAELAAEAAMELAKHILSHHPLYLAHCPECSALRHVLAAAQKPEGAEGNDDGH